jgi:YesN/AraC family two-component response regulator
MRNGMLAKTRHKGVGFWKTLRIVVAEDVPSIRLSLCKILEEFKFERIIEAENGSDAWLEIVSEIESAGHVDLVITDINMPKMNGISLLKRIKENPLTKDIPVLMVSTLNEREIILKAIQLGVDNYIVKPFERDIVRKKLVQIFYNQF